MLAELERIEQDALSALQQVEDEEGLEQWRISHLGRSSPLMQVFDQVGQMPKADRPAVGRRANQVKRNVEVALEEKAETLRRAALERALKA